MSNARIAALRSMVRDARAARVADKLPEDRRPHGFAISISLGKPTPEEDDGEASAAGGYATDEDKTYPGIVRPDVPGLDKDEEDAEDEDGY